MDNQSLNLLDRALGLDQQSEPWPLRGRVVVIEDCVETSGSFVLHQLLKRSLPPNSSNVIIFVGFANSFSHYDRVLRKLVRKSDGDEGKNGKGALVSLYEKVQKTLSGLHGDEKNYVTIMIDDISLMEVAANGASDYVLDFLHYCHALTSEFDCTLVTLNHEDIYSSMEGPTFILQMEYLADILIKAEPLSTGLATDVHGQLTILNKGASHRLGRSGNKIQNFRFKVKENSVEYFYPGSRV